MQMFSKYTNKGEEDDGGKISIPSSMGEAVS